MIRKLRLKNAEGERDILLEERMCVGRDIDCEISDNDALLSRRHAEFVSARTGVTVRDLSSLNGISVNGRQMDEARLASGDVVQIGNLSLTFVEETDSAGTSPGRADTDQTVLASPGSIPSPIEDIKGLVPTEASDSMGADGTAHETARVSTELSPSVSEGTVSQAPRTGVDADAGAGDDRTILAVPGSVAPAPPLGRAESPEQADPTESADLSDDRTILVAPGSVPAALSSGRAESPEQADSAATTDPSDDRTILMVPGSAPPGLPSGRGDSQKQEGRSATDDQRWQERTIRAMPDAPKPQPVIEVTGEQQTEQETSEKRRVPRASWAARVLVQVLALAASVLLMTAIPMHFFQERLLGSVAEERANAMVHWLAADASAALSSQPSDIGSAADDVGMQPGVSSALILSPDGQVLAPGTRGGEFVEMIPGISSPDEVQRPQSVWNGDSVEIVQPVRVGNNPRAAIAWLTFRPAALLAVQNSIVVLVPAVLIALVGGLVVAGVIRRTTFRALTALNEDVELAMAGQLTHIEDRLGAKPVRDLVMNVSHLIMRVRRAADKASLPRARTVGETRAVVTPGVGQARSVVARLVTDSKFRITNASPDCERILGKPMSDLVGQHVIDAIQDKNITDELLRCLGVATEGGEAKGTIKPTDKTPGITLVLVRDKKSGPLTITLTAEASADF